MAKTMHVLWLKPEDYPRFRAIFNDVDDTYEEWRARMERKIPDYIKQGVYIERMLIDPDALVEWCRANGRPVDAQARAIYPAILAAERDSE